MTLFLVKIDALQLDASDDWVVREGSVAVVVSVYLETAPKAAAFVASNAGALEPGHGLRFTVYEHEGDRFPRFDLLQSLATLEMLAT